MTRIAPTLTLLAVAALGGGMFVANAINDPATTGAAPAAAPAALAAPTGPDGPNILELSEITVVGAPGGTGDAAPGRTEISLSELPVAQPDAPAAGPPSAYVGQTDDEALAVTLAVRGDDAAGFVSDGSGVEARLSGTATGGTLTLRSSSGRTVLTGRVGAAGVNGTVTVDGVESGYRAATTDVATAQAKGRIGVKDVVSRLEGSR